MLSTIKTNINQHMIRTNICVEKYKKAMLRGFNRGDVPVEVTCKVAQQFPGFAKNPSSFSKALPIVVIPFRLHIDQQVLIEAREA